jgi:surfactin synthase thioesterase subunit
MSTLINESYLVRLTRLTDIAPDEWFIPTTRHADSVMTIAAFPQAGGGCSAFVQQAKSLPAWLGMLTLNLPGRQARYGEPLLTEIDPLAEELAAYWAKHPKPFLFFGYCSGAVLAYRVACVMHERGSEMPSRLIVGSYKVPHLISMRPLLNLDSESFWDTLIKNQAVPPQVAAIPELRELSEAVMHADLMLVADHEQVQPKALPVPITILVGDQDEWITPEDLSGWARYTTSGTEVRRLPAGHWFMEEAPQAAIEALAATAARLPVPSTGLADARMHEDSAR